MLREKEQSWRCNLRELGSKVTGKERGQPGRSREQTPREGPGLLQVGARGSGFSDCRQAGRLDQAFSRQGEWPLAARAWGDPARHGFSYFSAAG